jgi:hypothetical protein
MKPHRTSKRIAAVTRIEVAVIIAVVGFIALAVLPAVSAAKRLVQTTQCRDNLKSVGLSFRLWAGENGPRCNRQGDFFPMGLSITNGGTLELVEKADAFVHFQVLSNVYPNFLSNRFESKFLVCPADKEKVAAVSFATSFGNQNVSYFIDLDTKEDGTETNILAGDRNLTLNGTPLPSGLLKLTADSAVGWSKQIHKRRGQLVFADGRVEENITSLQPFLKATGLATNRLAIP